jgi:hypothetical protein
MTDNNAGMLSVNGGFAISSRLYLGDDVVVKDISLYDTLMELKNTVKTMQLQIIELEAKNKELEERLIEVEYAPTGVMCEQARLEFESLAEHKD